MIEVSAPGKVHIIGEHAVVYGHPAIISAVNLRTNLIFKESKNFIFKSEDQEYSFDYQELIDIAGKAGEFLVQGKPTSDFNNLFSLYKNDSQGFLKVTLGTLLEQFKISSGLEIKEKSTLPRGAGLGSSASFSVALSAGFQKLFVDNLDLDQINKNAFLLEQLLNGNPSGGDNATCCYGGLIKFQRSLASDHVQVTPLNVALTEESRKFILIYTGKPQQTTGELVAQVKRLDPSMRDQIFQEISFSVDPLLLALANGNSNQITNHLNQTHLNLSRLGVSTHLLDQVQQDVYLSGGGAKLCGAGGGGVILAYHSTTQELIAIASKLNLQYYHVELASPGVKLV